METLKSIVITLVTMLVFISAVEIITPDNKMKKYIKFILGLILISVILNPIINLISNGEKNLPGSIEDYETVFNNDKTNLINMATKENENKVDVRKKEFINNFNKNCDNLLKNQFRNMNFKCEVECDVNFTNVSLNIKKLKIGIGENKVNKIKKIVINNKEESNKQELNEEYIKIIDFVSKELDISKEKIEVYKLDE
ncbi:stage III sporulation protein AF [Clostridium sp. C2-6-12]|uniref:stage III sporulation protein AF n=1 Tax=Clostridium sp. C2-6-12 TaxID=2698832 RepID=UPI001922179F|nr:stage III sporulation protein AF [Clostridium sp. C2-6-12]